MIRLPSHAGIGSDPTDTPRAKLDGFATILGAMSEPPPRLAPASPPRGPGREGEPSSEVRPAGRPRPRPLRNAGEPPPSEPAPAPTPLPMLGWLGLSLEGFDTLDATALEPIDSESAVAGPAPLAAELAQDLDTLDVQISVERRGAPSVPTLGLAADPITGDGAVFEFPRPEPRPTAATAPPERPAQFVAPLPRDPIRDDGLVFHFPRVLNEPIVELEPVEAGESEGGEDEPGESGLGALLGVAPLPHHDAAMPKVEATDAAELRSDFAERAEAATLQQDANAQVGDTLTVRLDDRLGRWEVDVTRNDNLLDLVLRGDAELQATVRESTPELRERLAEEGLTLNEVTTMNASPNGDQARREEAPPWPVARSPRPVRGAQPAPIATTAPRGLLDRTV